MRVPHLPQEREYSCLAACVRMVLASFGSHHGEGELRALLKTRPAGTSPGTLAIRLPEIGFDAAVFDGSLPLLRQFVVSQQPCIVHLWTTALPHWDSEALHAVVVTDIDDVSVTINDPTLDHAPIYVPLAAFTPAWAATDYVLVIITPRP
jgi:ABC-type bacteriocin/lantibiotic exporter with double-glycine peptidase domain